MKFKVYRPDDHSLLGVYEGSETAFCAVLARCTTSIASEAGEDWTDAIEERVGHLRVPEGDWFVVGLANDAESHRDLRVVAATDDLWGEVATVGLLRHRELWK